MPVDPSSVKAVVIGAGQAGLSVAYHLKRLGLQPGGDLVILDRGPDTGGAWQHRWESLRVGTAHRINDLPGMGALGLTFDDADRSSPASTVVGDYYRRYERYYELRVIRPASVTSVTPARDAKLAVVYRGDGGAKVESPGETSAERPVETRIETEVVVNASGTWGSPFRPWYPGLESFTGRSLHTTDYRSAAEFAGQRVVVVGGGTSAIGFLLELERVASRTLWVTRGPVRFLDEGRSDLEARLAAVQAQDEAARGGLALPSIVSGTGVPRTRRIATAIDRGLLVPQPMFTRIEPNGVRFADGTFSRADAIIWATGFRPELRHLAPLGLRDRAGGIEVVDGVAARDPRVFFAGYGPSASTIGANRAGRSIARKVMARLSSRR